LEHKEHPKWTLECKKINLPMQRPSWGSFINQKLFEGFIFGIMFF